MTAHSAKVTSMFKRLLLALALAVLPLGAMAQTDTASTTTAATSVAIQQTTQAAKMLLDLGFHLSEPDIVTVTTIPKGCFQTTCVKTQQMHNARVDTGAQFVANQIGNTSSVTTAVANYIALSSDSGTVLKTDTTCPTELTTSGMGRKVSSFTYVSAPTTLGGSATYTLSNSYTATGSYTINKLCLFNAVSAGTMLFETLLGSTVSGSSGDVVNVTWTVNE